MIIGATEDESDNYQMTHHAWNYSLNLGYEYLFIL